MCNRLSVSVRAAIWTLAIYAGAARGIDDAAKQIGERLFREPRFAQLYFAECNGNVNATVPGDPNLNFTVAPSNPLPSPFAGQTMNCRVCHMEDEFKGVAGAGMRTYADFARRTPIPNRGDGKTVTTRNTQQLVNTSIPRTNFFLHFDGEFADGVTLTQGALTGRNMGWLASEHDVAVKHIVKVIKEDNGQGALAQAFGGAYAKVFAADPSVPADLQISAPFRIDVTKASDADIMVAIGKLVNEYMQSLVFSKDSAGNYNGSPYDAFLAKNALPRKPNANETSLAYGRRLRTALAQLSQPKFIGPADGQFVLHQIPYVFGPDELAGLRMFLNEPAVPLQNGKGRRITRALPPPPPPPPPPPQPLVPQVAGIGNCIACHAPPDFTDQVFHNTGVAQSEYDSLHGLGSFERLAIPTLAQRNANPGAYLPATSAHPNYSGVFRSVPSRETPGVTDLGMWNVYLNPDIPGPQKLLNQVTNNLFGPISAAAMLDRTIATFKTPGLRDLADSQPYLHDGSKDTLRDVMDFYLRVSQLARDGHLRNADPEIPRIQLNPQQAVQIAKFLNALTEDFQD